MQDSRIGGCVRLLVLCQCSQFTTVGPILPGLHAVRSGDMIPLFGMFSVANVGLFVYKLPALQRSKDELKAINRLHSIRHGVFCPARRNRRVGQADTLVIVLLRRLRSQLLRCIRAIFSTRPVATSSQGLRPSLPWRVILMCDFRKRSVLKTRLHCNSHKDLSQERR